MTHHLKGASVPIEDPEMSQRSNLGEQVGPANINLNDKVKLLTHNSNLGLTKPLSSSDEPN